MIMKKFFLRLWARIIMSDEVARDIQDHLRGVGTEMEKAMRMQRIGLSRWLKHPRGTYWSHPAVRGRRGDEK